MAPMSSFLPGGAGRKFPEHVTESPANTHLKPDPLVFSLLVWYLSSRVYHPYLGFKGISSQVCGANVSTAPSPNTNSGYLKLRPQSHPLEDS